MWVKLLGSMSIREGLQSSMVNGVYRPPLITGRKKAELRKIFIQCGLPWIYEEPQLHHVDSPYNRPIRAALHDKRFTKRLEDIQKQLKDSDQKELQYRREQVAKKVPQSLDRYVIDMLAALGMRDKLVLKKGIKAEKAEKAEKADSARKTREKTKAAKKKTGVVKRIQSDIKVSAPRRHKERYSLIKEM